MARFLSPRFIGPVLIGMGCHYVGQFAASPENHSIFSSYTSKTTGTSLPPLVAFAAGTRLGNFLDWLARSAKPPNIALFGMINGHQQTQAVKVFAKLRMAEALEAHATGGDRRADVLDVASAVGADPEALRRLLRFLAASGLVDSDGDPSTTRFGNTPASRYLLKEAEGSLWGAAVLDDHFEGWLNLEASVTKGAGTVAFDDRFGMPIFDYYAKHPDTEQAFAHFMSGISMGPNAAIAASGYDFGANCRAIADVGGGHGSLLAEIVSAFPSLAGRATVVDLEGVVSTAPARDGVAFAAGDMFDPARLPQGGGVNCYALKVVLHDWSDEQAIKILVAVRAALRAAGVDPRRARLLLAEQVLRAGDPLGAAKAALDVNMMVMCGGKERTQPEWAALLRAAGWTLARAYATRSVFTLMEAYPADAHE